MTTLLDDIPSRLRALERRSMYRRRRVVGSPQGRELVVDGRRLLNFCSNDYLGLAGDVRVREALMEGARRWGVGAGASHLVCGHTAAHHDLERRLAELTGRPRALLFSSGYAANLAVINALIGKRDGVYEDRLNHASLLDGGWLSGARFTWYAHADPADLDAQLAACGGAGHRLVVTDGVFSMDGHRCPLPALIDVTARRDAALMVDDAHGFGVTGPDGCGSVDPRRFGTREVPILMATLGKAIGVAGAFVAGDEALIEFLIQRARNYIYTTAMPAALAVAALCSVGLAVDESWRRTHLESLIERFRAGMARAGLGPADSDTPIQPVVVGDAERAVAASRALEAAGFLVTPIRPPTVPPGTSRLRVTLTAAHTERDVDELVAALAKALENVDMQAAVRR